MPLAKAKMIVMATTAFWGFVLDSINRQAIA
jgi:hypothetical protein